MSDFKLGVLLWSQSTDWPSFERAAQRDDELGYEHLWTWDHLHAIFGDPQQNIFEGWITLGAWAKATRRVRLGLLVGANTFRNPALVAKLATTLDHISEGRAILGLGGAWFDYEHQRHGIDFGKGFGQRLDWMDESVAAVRTVLDGGSGTSTGDGGHRVDDLRQEALPLPRPLPIMIGGSGEKKTLRTIAKYADMWNGMGTVDEMRHKMDVLLQHCADVGRDPAAIVKTTAFKPVIRDSAEEADKVWRAQMANNKTPISEVEDDATFVNGPSEFIAEHLIAMKEVGFTEAIAEMAAPYDEETLERLIREVKPLVDQA